MYFWFLDCPHFKDSLFEFHSFKIILLLGKRVTGIIFRDVIQDLIRSIYTKFSEKAPKCFLRIIADLILT